MLIVTRSNKPVEWRSESIIEITRGTTDRNFDSRWTPGEGGLQDYRTGAGIPGIEEQLAEQYGPVLTGTQVDLYVARQWSEPSPAEEEALLGHDAVTGLVYNSFRHDNAESVQKHQGDWIV